MTKKTISSDKLKKMYKKGIKTESSVLLEIKQLIEECSEKEKKELLKIMIGKSKAIIERLNPELKRQKEIFIYCNKLLKSSL